MTIIKRSLVLLCAMLPAAIWAQTGAANNEVLVRIERVRGDENVCALIKQSGAYHLERVGRFADPMTSEVYEGVLPANGISDVQSWVNSDELRRLTQPQIAFIPKNNEAADMVLLNFRREGSWYNLNFFTADSRKAAAKTLDPLTAWIDRVALERPGAAKVATGPTRCSSSPDAARAVREESRQNAERAKPKFAMRIFTDRLDLRNERMARTCALVYPDGRYHFEKAAGSILNEPKPRIFEGSVTVAQVTEMRRLLEAPELKSRTGNEIKPAPAREDFELAYLVVPRPEGVQSVTLSTVEELKLVQPVRKWIVDAIERQNSPELNGAKPTACYPPAE